MDNTHKTGIQISHQAVTRDIAVVNGGIKINASGRPLETDFKTEWGRIYILLDCSGSMKRSKLDQAKTGITKFTQDAFKKDYWVGVIKFADQAEHLCEPTNNIERLESAIKEIKGNGSTNLTDAIRTAHLKLKNYTTGTKVMVIATDGMPDNSKSSMEAAQDAKTDGIEIITIGTDDADKDFLKKIASRTDLSTKVASDKFSDAISSASLLLMSPKGLLPR